MEKYRKFDGKRFTYVGTVRSKRLAREHKNDLKKKGYSVRIISVKDGYAIYARR